MAIASCDATLQELRAGAARLHLGIVVALQRDTVKVAEMIKEMGRDSPKVGGVSNAITEAFDRKAVRAKVVMLKMNRVTFQPFKRRESVDVECSYEWRQFGGVEDETINLIGVTVDRDIQLADGRNQRGEKWSRSR
jgi:1-aminocyclopropane-1-carboxylate deaminase/D-cysteine desulfhydrase-like pyridoxal-dependent ACC family enzyme